MDILDFFRFLGDKKKAHYLIFTLIVLFLIFTAVVAFLPTTVIDIEFSEEVQEDSSPLLNFIMKAISWFGVSAVALTLVLGTALIFFLYKYRTEALFVLSTLGVTLLTFGIKVLINRPRPTADLVNIVEHAQHQSFPSGHTTFYLVFFGFLSFLMLRNHYLNKPLRIFVISLSFLLIFTVPFSRIYLGAHWFTDVGAGFVLGLLYLYFLIRIYLNRKHQGK